MRAIKKMQGADAMGTGELKYGPIARAINETFYCVDPGRYSEKDWHQVRAKDHNMRKLFKEIQRDLNQQVKTRKQVRLTSCVAMCISVHLICHSTIL